MTAVGIAELLGWTRVCVHAFAIVVTIIQPLPIFIPFFLLSCSGRRKQKKLSVTGFFCLLLLLLFLLHLSAMGTVLQTGTGEEVPRPVLLSLFFFFLCTVHSRNEKKRKECTKWCVCARGSCARPPPFPVSSLLQVWACWGTT